MEEIIKEFIANYLPSVASIAATFAGVATFFAKVKAVVKNKELDSKTLGDNLTKYASNLDEMKNKVLSYIESTNGVVEGLKQQNEELKTEVEALKYSIGQNQEIIKQNTALKNQLSVLLREEQADGKNK